MGLTRFVCLVLLERCTHRGLGMNVLPIKLVVCTTEGLCLVLCVTLIRAETLMWRLRSVTCVRSCCGQSRTMSSCASSWSRRQQRGRRRRSRWGGSRTDQHLRQVGGLCACLSYNRCLLQTDAQATLAACMRHALRCCIVPLAGGGGKEDHV